MSQIVYNNTTGHIISVFDDAETIPSLPATHSILSEAGDPADFIEKQINLIGPVVQTRDYLKFNGPATQDVSTVNVHGVQKIDGITDLDLSAPGDNDSVQWRLGDENATPASGIGFTAEEAEDLLNGAATVNVASGPIAGGEYLHIRSGSLGDFKKKIDYT